MTDRRSPDRWTTVVLTLLVLITVAFNAIMLLPELRQSVPYRNDDLWHYMLIRRASEALAAGENPFDHWYHPEAGFPKFLYYQHLPHLAVVALHRLLLKQVGLFKLLNLVRYLLLVGFPLTVYWSMRQMEFSAVAAAVAAAFAPLIAANRLLGFEYGTYTWLGMGMYPQLWAMHLLFISVACLQRLLTRGTGYLAATIACSMLVLSHLLYAYMAAIAALALFLLSLYREPRRPLRKSLRQEESQGRLSRPAPSLPSASLRACLSTSGQDETIEEGGHLLRRMLRQGTPSVRHLFSTSR